MQGFALMWPALALSVFPAEADSITVHGFSNNTAATDLSLNNRHPILPSGRRRSGDENTELWSPHSALHARWNSSSTSRPPIPGRERS